jgi:glucose/arabinose dehydrogenase
VGRKSPADAQLGYSNAMRASNRPVGVAVDNDGALLVGDDANGTLWRVTYP